MIKNWRWFISKRLRGAVEDRKQIIKLLAAQRDLIKPAKIEELEKALSELDKLCRGSVDKEELQAARADVLNTAEKVLIPYPDASYRDLVEMALVVIALVLAFRTFFFQPFKIPTGSMQPTLYGITVEDLKNRFSGDITGGVEQGILTASEQFFLATDQGRTMIFDNGKSATITEFLSGETVKVEPAKNIEQQPFTVTFEIPGKARYVIEKLRGYSYHSLQAEGNWQLEHIQPPQTIFPFINKQILVFRDVDSDETIRRTAWFPPFGSSQKPVLTDTTRDFKPPATGDLYSTGEFVYKLRVKTGDHLFVNRITYNFRDPKRGDITVFTIKKSDATHGEYSGLPIKDTFYIKRLIGMGGEKIHIGLDRHLIVGDRRLSSIDKGFEFVYSHPKVISRDLHRIPLNPVIKSVYSGHESLLNVYGPDLSFTNTNSPYKVPDNHYLFFGDNTASSMDSRSWGALPKGNVIGHSSFVYWPPLSPRFGWSHR